MSNESNWTANVNRITHLEQTQEILRHTEALQTPLNKEWNENVGHFIWDRGRVSFTWYATTPMLGNYSLNRCDVTIFQAWSLSNGKLVRVALITQRFLNVKQSHESYDSWLLQWKGKSSGIKRWQMIVLWFLRCVLWGN